MPMVSKENNKICHVLGIESSCDETSLAWYDGARGLLAQVLHSQIDVHRPYGGVVPELAARDHIQRLEPLYRELLAQCQMEGKDIDLVAYTAGPGLSSALMTGAVFGRSLALVLQKPCIGVHHMEAHLVSVQLDKAVPDLPYIALLVSGGHTLLVHVGGIGDYRILGKSVDDACGEAFDKVAKLLGLGYPGGPAVSRLALSGRTGYRRFSRPMARCKNLDMSFSGLKTQVLREIQKCVYGSEFYRDKVRRNAIPRAADLDLQDKADIALAFEECVVDVLTDRAIRALEASACSRLVVAGGVGANAPLRSRLRVELDRRDMELFIPPVAYCTDNAAMVAYLGWCRRRQADSPTKIPPCLIRPRWRLDSLNI